MAKSSVAVLDIRSSEITAAVGARGVNGTFIVKSKYTASYEGFAEGELIEVKSFTTAILDVVKRLISSVNDKIKTFYIGVPGEFLKVINTDKTISFSSSKKIKRSDVASLIKYSSPEAVKGYEVFYNAALYYVLSDKRRTVNPIGAVSDCLRGKLCFYLCKNSFIDCVENAFKEFNKIQLVFLPSCHTEATYL
ncbi:MAG: hypothetical protein J6B04_00175, partial [Clostridia bacterium]|nr:hypothetical protein [Clostridia bacterium]